MALIEVNPDFKRVLKELRRIAAALEMYLLLAHGYRTQPPSKAELAASDEPGVEYATDEGTMLREAEEARREMEATDEAGLVK
jgi:hypothetical protein